MLDRPIDPDVRLARDADRGALLETLVDAFDDYPLTTWAVLRDRQYARRIRAYFRMYLELAWPYQLVWTASDCRAAALWFPPEQFSMGLSNQLRLLPTLWSFAGARRFASRLAGFRMLAAHHPDVPHYYLAVLGVRTDSQGQGVGAAVLSSVLDRCDREGVAAFLHTSNPRAIPFYERHGFARQDTVHPPHGPPVQAMLRPARVPKVE